jgi:hypothetical protein
MNKILTLVLACVATLCGCEANLQLETKPKATSQDASAMVTIVPFTLEGGDRYFVTTLLGTPGYSGGKEIKTLLDTGSAITMVDSLLLDQKPTGSTSITTFNGTVLHVVTVSKQLCIASECETEDVAIVPGLYKSIGADVVLRGSFLNQFQSAEFNFETSTLDLGPRK